MLFGVFRIYQNDSSLYDIIIIRLFQFVKYLFWRGLSNLQVMAPNFRLKGAGLDARHHQRHTEFTQCTRSLNKMILKVLWSIIAINMGSCLWRKLSLPFRDILKLRGARRLLRPSIESLPSIFFL